MVQIKFFEASSLGFLEIKVNRFLERLDKKKIINVSIATSEQENIHPSKANYIAAILYDETTEEI
jgi:DNA-binding transcriptional regulator LsrR (DeoR family)